MKHYLLPLPCKNIAVTYLDNAGWIISKILYTFVNVDRINQWYLSKNEDSCHSLYCKVVGL